MLVKHKKSWFIIGVGIFSFILLITAFIFLVFDKDYNNFRVINNITVILGGLIILIIGIVRHKTVLISDELQKRIQLEIFSYTHIAFLTFLSLFALLQITYHFKLEPMQVLIIVLFGTSILQLIISFFVKRKYK
jgi:hypothetical protein